MPVGICTDSSAQLPADLAAQHDVEVVPMTITVGDAEYLDGVDIDPDEFYEMVASGQPAVSAVEPSPGQFAVAYDELVARGCTEILSVHAANRCGNLMAARVAARSVTVPVRLVDSPTDGFGVGCCAITAAEAAARGATLDEAADLARSTAVSLRTAIVADARPLVRGRGEPAQLVFQGHAPATSRLDDADTIDAAVDVLRTFLLRAPRRERVAIGIADREVGPLRDALSRALADRAAVGHFRIGPSAAAVVGPGALICSAY